MTLTQSSAGVATSRPRRLMYLEQVVQLPWLFTMPVPSYVTKQ
jgi:hypothetical protein